MNRAIVTGANGFIGSSLVKELIKHDIEVLAIVRNNNCRNIPYDSNVKILSLEMSQIWELKDIIEPNHFDTFYHFAWTGSSGESRIDEKLQMQNALWTCDSLKVAKEIGCKRFVGAGSIMEKEAELVIYTQESKPTMSYIYGVGKMTAHCLAKPISNSIGIELLWGVITNAYGEGEISPRFINTTIRKIINKEPLHFTSAEQNYDFVHISDVANAFYCIGEKGKANSEYIIGSSNPRPLRDFIIELKHTLAPEAEFIFGNIPFTGVSMPLSIFDTSITEKDTGFRAKVSFKEGLKQTMKWILEEKEME